jgi:hypothetical protein
MNAGRTELATSYFVRTARVIIYQSHQKYDALMLSLILGHHIDLFLTSSVSFQTLARFVSIKNAPNSF